MTAEIAILNKSAVALAADSAVTIIVGDREDKIFDSADKLFELSAQNPIGIMIYNVTSFAEAPLQNIICDFREKSQRFDRVEIAAEKFLQFLNGFGNKAPDQVTKRSVGFFVHEMVDAIHSRFNSNLMVRLPALSGGDNAQFTAALNECVELSVSVFERTVGRLDDAMFVGGGEFQISNDVDVIISAAVSGKFAFAPPEQAERIKAVTRISLKKSTVSGGKTGIVIAGYGTGELFPTLVSYEVYGMICGRLKYSVTNKVDIDRNGDKAKVLPFAQKEMVERFLYGLDENTQESIASYCSSTINQVATQIIDRLNLSEEDLTALKADSEKAESAFLDGIRTVAFERIRSGSREEIEGMVEFMPKPEMAKMAEALVNLTSIKRRVSRGMETVGGPIDVAVISKTEGFVWVKRKHYFPAELNGRYHVRAQERLALAQEGDTNDAGHRKPRTSRSKSQRRKTNQPRSIKGFAGSHRPNS